MKKFASVFAIVFVLMLFIFSAGYVINAYKTQYPLYYDETTGTYEFKYDVNDFNLVGGKWLALDCKSAGLIYISKDGSDTTGNGSIVRPYLTVTKALASVTTAKKTILIFPGTYSEAAALVWPSVTGVSLIGIGDKVAITAPETVTTQVLGINPTYTAGTFEASITNIEIDHGTAGQDGIVVTNTACTKKINLYLKNVYGSGEATDKSLLVTNTRTDAAIRAYITGNGETWEGLISFVTTDVGDRLRANSIKALGGITVAGAVAAEVTLTNTGILTSGLTVNGANKLTNVGCWYMTDADPTVYTALNNAYATY